MDETYLKIKRQWKNLYRAVDKAGQTIGFLLTANRDKNAAIEALKEAAGQGIEICQIKYLDNLVEQDHGDQTNRSTHARLQYLRFSARCTLRGIELMHMIKKGQMIADDGKKLSAAGQFYSLAA